MIGKNKSIHFIGIGGIGMSAIAEILHKLGFKVTGSDINENIIIKKLIKKGIKVFSNHSSKNVQNSDMIVFSSAIKKNNQELKFAQKKKIPILSRASMLAEVMRLKSSITVAGSHGKTTTTSLIATILEKAGFDPTIINGGIINSFQTNAKLGKGDWLVAEADESDGSFVFLPSTIGLINNIDLEHVDFYNNLNQIKEAFIEYAKNIPFYGFIALCIDSKNVRDIKEKLFEKKIFTYGLDSTANFYAKDIKIIEIKKRFFSQFDVIINLKKKKKIKNVIVPIIGNHNIQNILGSICVAKGLGVKDLSIKKALRNYEGVKRRFSIIFKNRNNMIIDDYAHHPQEIKKTLESLKSITQKKIFTVFEPHRFSRVSRFLDDFIMSLKYSDFIYILPIYSAGENNKEKISSLTIEKKLKKKFKNKFIRSVVSEKDLFNDLDKKIFNGDNIIFLGAGLSSRIADRFANFFK